ncbi:hypothetical protein VNO80_13259 [Phaseolus coccineus]|uniref:Uncharacterized protein n=1 Tax=Phaseolus coccineus TaxID=3886 RepID=A0AAN9N0M3_PHACN
MLSKENINLDVLGIGLDGPDINLDVLGIKQNINLDVLDISLDVLDIKLDVLDMNLLAPSFTLPMMLKLNTMLSPST